MRRDLSLAACLCILGAALVLSAHPLRAQTGRQPVLVATSRSPLATAYNNGRRLVRDSRDNRYLVYHDLRGSEPIVCFVRSADGRAWSQPDTLADGVFPSIAIDQGDRLYVVWQEVDQSGVFFTYSLDGGLSWKWPPSRLDPTAGASGWRGRFPVVEAGARRVHFAWQQEGSGTAGKWRSIFFASMPLDSLEACFPGSVAISQTGIDAQLPSLACNLAWEEGPVHVVWCDSMASRGGSISYRKTEERTGLWTPQLHEPAVDLTAGGCAGSARHPAVSVGAGEVVHVVWSHDCGGFHSALLFNPNNLMDRFDQDVSTGPCAMVCVDDIYFKYSTLVWVAADEIYYMQTRDGTLLSSEPIPVSALDGVPSRHPSVCYKYFRADFLDVVWTDGSEPPYRIFYRRMEKIYRGSQVVEGAPAALPSGLVLVSSHPNPFRATTLIRYALPAPALVGVEIFDLRGQRVRTLVNAWNVAGEHRVSWDGPDELGRPVPGGVYPCRLRAGGAVSWRRVTLLR